MARKKDRLNIYGLTDHEEEFCHLYVKHKFNGTRAMKEANPALATGSAAAQACRVLKKDKILARIDMILAEMMRRIDIQAEDVVQELARGATFNVKDLMSWDGEGYLTIRPSDEISRDAASAIKSIRHTTRTTKTKDDGETTERRIEFNFVSKEKYLELLGRYFAMFIDRKEVTNTKDLVSRMQAAEKRIAKGGSIELVEDKESPPA